MALDFLVIDGFEGHTNLAASFTGDLWPGSVTGNMTLVTGASARFSYGTALRKTSGSGWLQRPIPDCTKVQFGMAMFRDGSSNAEGYIAAVRRATAAAAPVSPSGVHVNDLGQVSFFRDATAVATSTRSLGVSRWHYVECYLEYHATTGVAKIWINGELVVDFTGNTLGTLNTPVTNDWRSFRIFDGSLTAMRVDDVYFAIPSGSAEPLFDARVLTYFPTTTVSFTDWTEAVGTMPTLLGDKDAATLVSSNVDQAKVIFSISNIDDVAPEAIYGVALTANADKSGAAARSIAMGVKPDGAAAQDYGDENFLSVGGVESFQQTWDINPDTALAWEIDDLTGAEFAARLTVYV